ncbi:Uncharacterised protein [Mycobacteroides abscessus subsp. massiliense]|nr:Uncharacterised protein [Mycobacteroides abscessus subsp. massiliense]
MDDLSVGMRVILWAVSLLVAIVTVVVLHHLGVNPLRDFISLTDRFVDDKIGPYTGLAAWL